VGLAWSTDCAATVAWPLARAQLKKAIFASEATWSVSACTSSSFALAACEAAA
jgi:hypothetical protein